MYKLVIFLFLSVAISKSVSLNAKLREEANETSTIAGEQGQNHTESSVTEDPLNSSTSEAGSSTPSLIQILKCIRKCPLVGNNNPVCGSDGNTSTNGGFLECVKSCTVKGNPTKPCPMEPLTS